MQLPKKRARTYHRHNQIGFASSTVYGTVAHLIGILQTADLHYAKRKSHSSCPCFHFTHPPTSPLLSVYLPSVRSQYHTSHAAVDFFTGTRLYPKCQIKLHILIICYQPAVIRECESLHQSPCLSWRKPNIKRQGTLLILQGDIRALGGLGSQLCNIY